LVVLVDCCFGLLVGGVTFRLPSCEKRCPHEGSLQICESLARFYSILFYASALDAEEGAEDLVLDCVYLRMVCLRYVLACGCRDGSFGRSFCRSLARCRYTCVACRIGRVGLRW
jgi:hypothetical protein